MAKYGSIEQTKRRRRKHGSMATAVDCGCLGLLSPCEHHEEWRQRNIRLLKIRKPQMVPISWREIVQREVER